LKEDKLYDVAIVGGGLAGLALAIQLGKQGHAVILLEKESYPFHKVCGEYISLESWDFLKSLGVDPQQIGVAMISQLQVSTIAGTVLNHPLPLGGFGISRHKLDHILSQLASAAGVLLIQSAKVQEITFNRDEFLIDTDGQRYRSTLACACYGKRSNIDIKWKRPFSIASKNKLNNFIGVKYHIRTDLPVDTISLHNFNNGYCGIVKIEDDLYNLCYLSTAENLKQSGGNIREMERTILSENPHLKKIFHDNRIVFDAPLTISQISFDKKAQVENHVLMIGDASGMITPLCGNGMSMALHGSKMAFLLINSFLRGAISRADLEKKYSQQWKKTFAARLLMGRRIQHLLSNRWISNAFIQLIKPFPTIIDLLVKRTHGKPF
jgi:flavin-dependent dehydrogenase